jgi:uncharacterized membrane protein YfcA
MPDWLLPANVTPAIFVLLVAISFFTSALTAAFGIGGGVAMLGALAGTVPPAMVVAVHGVVQFGSNIGRAVLQRAHILWRPTALFTLGSVIGAGLGAAVFVALPEKLLLGLLGLFILLMTWIPKPRIPGLETFGVFAGGIIATFVTMFVGATGPFVQALFLPMGLEKRVLVATHAACNVIQHGLKALAFGWLGFNFADWAPLLVAMILSGFLGTWLGTTLLEKLPEALFKTILKWLLTVLALDLLRRAAGF